MSDNNKERNPFLGTLWADSTEIQKGVENYNSIKWYKSVRFVPVFFVLIMTTIYELRMEKYTFGPEWWNIVVGFAMFLPFIYLMVKGYRVVILCWIILYTINMWDTILFHPKTSVVVHLIWWCVITGCGITALRIENARHKIDSIKSTLLKDIIVIIIYCTIIGVGFFPVLNKSNDSLAYCYAAIHKNTKGITSYCTKQGVLLQEYPFAFKRQYAKEIELVNNMLKNSEYLLSTYNQELAEYDRNFEYINNERKYYISDFIIEEMHINPNEFTWKDEYWDIMSGSDYCRLMDNSFDGLYKEGYFSEFESNIEQLKK